ncbi:MAG: caspase family protein [Saprospirales bacterium]|nr:caspase family protein [Saprospirales bacterium]
MSTPERGIGAYQSGQGIGGTARGNNYLLVIGIDAYLHFPHLNNAVRDAQTFANLLQQRYEFDAENTEVLFNENATERQLLFKLRDMARLITPADNLVIYFSGHGEYDEILKEGYWIPVDAEPDAPEDFIPNSKIHTVLNAIQSRHTFLVIDSCFSGSLFMQFRSGAGGDRLEMLPSRWGLTSGRNEVVPDGPSGHHSPFAESLLNQLTLNQGTLGVGELCQRVVESVAARSNQIPRGEPLRVSGHEGGQFIFRLRASEMVKDTSVEPKPSLPTKGGLLYSIPQAMELGQESRCEVRIAFNKATLFQDFDKGKDHTVRDIRISNLMEVELIDPLLGGVGAFTVRTISSAEQFIDPDDYTQWVFYVKALHEGIHPLVLKVTVIESIEGRERRKEIVLEENIEVRAQAVKAPQIGWRESGYSFSMGQATTEGLEIANAPSVVQPSPFPEFESPPPAPQARRRNLSWIRNTAAILVLLIGVVAVIQWIAQPNFFSTQPADRQNEYKEVREPLTEARELLEREEPDLPRAEELLEIVRRSAQQKEALPEPLIREIKNVELLFEERRRMEQERNSAEPRLEPVDQPRDKLTGQPKSGEVDKPEDHPLDSFLDQRDGKKYAAVELLGRFWLQTNLAYTTEGMVCYNDRPVFCQNFGGLYTWETAMRACPKGWHLPELNEWGALVEGFGGFEEPNAFKVLSFGGGSFFEARLGGMQEPQGGFRSINEEGFFWSRTADGEKDAFAIVFDKKTNAIHRVPLPKKARLSCRCVRD